MITPRQAHKLERLIQLVVDAEVANSWKGGGDPADIPEIEAALTIARMRLKKLITELTEPL